MGTHEPEGGTAERASCHRLWMGADRGAECRRSVQVQYIGETIVYSTVYTTSRVLNP